MELWIKCEHGSLVRHGVPPEGTKKGEYVPAHKLEWCPGPTEFAVDWSAAYAAGEWMDRMNVTDFEGAVEEIVDAALGVERE